MATRDPALDMARGIGIILVVVGHSQISTTSLAVVCGVIFAFHMPLFFCLAGVFLRPGDGLGGVVAAKADALLKPYAVVLALVGLVVVATGRVPPGPYLAGIAWGTGTSIAAVAGNAFIPLWFLPSLFATLLVALPILKASAHLRRREPVLAGLAIALIAAGAATIRCCWEAPVPGALQGWFAGRPETLPGLPFSLDLVPVTSGFLLLGAVASGRIRGVRFHAWGVAAAAIAFAALFATWRQSINLSLREYGSFPVCTAQALLGIYLTLALAELAVRGGRSTRWLASLGRSSLVIMLFHWPALAVAHRLLPSAIDPRLALVPEILAGIAGPLVVAGVADRVPVVALALLPLRSRRRTG